MEFDSNEEKYFSWYLEVLRNWNFIESWSKNEKPWQLTEDLVITYVKPMKRVEDKIMKQTLFSGRVYTPDFIVKWTEQALEVFVQELNCGDKITAPFVCQDLKSIIEVKGGFDNNNMTRLAVNNIKDVYDKYDDYITMVKVPMIFKKTFTPERYLLTDKSFKSRKIKYATRSIKEFITHVSE
jgi:hypothetical protein